MSFDHNVLIGIKMEIVLQKESKVYPGYYHIPDIDYVVVSPTGKCVNTHSGRPVKISLDPAGYPKTTVRDKDGINHNCLLHRLLARAFIGRPIRHLDKDHYYLEVNHKDGDKSNYSLLNLEWVTPAENMEHAAKTGLSVGIPVLSKNILNGTITKYHNVIACCKEFEISIRRFRRHLNSVRAGTITKLWHVFKYDDGSSWPDLTPNQYQINNWDTLYCIWYAKNIDDGLIVFHNTLNDLCCTLNLSYTAVSTYILRHPTGMAYENWIFWKDDTPLESAIRELPTRNVPSGLREAIKVKFTSKIDSSIKEFDSIRKASKYLKIDEKTIKYSLTKLNGELKEYKVEYLYVID